MSDSNKHLTPTEAMMVQFAIIQKALSIVRGKRTDYSGADDPYRNLRSSAVHGVEGWRGVLVRIEDKLARIRTITESKNAVKLADLYENDFPDVVNYLSILAGLVTEELGMSNVLRQELLDRAESCYKEFGQDDGEDRF